jgi:replicative DNA helicase
MYERKLLGCYIEGAPIAEDIGAAFSTEPHKIIFKEIQSLSMRGVQLDIKTLTVELDRHNQLDKVGGAAYIADLTTAMSIVNLAFYETEVLNAAKCRTIWQATNQAQEALEKGADLNEVIALMTPVWNGISTAGRRASGILFSELIKKQFPSEDWLVDGLITTGLTVLTGASKIGKSWTALQLVTALDQGGYFLGTLKTQQCDVLYCALEDTQKRVQRRLQKQGITAFNGSRLETSRRTVNDLRAFLKANQNFRVVIIDTFQKMMGLRDLNDYSQTVDGMSALKDIADALNIAVIVIHHNRKSGNLDGDHMESALGSTGINATADTTLTMRRNRGAETATLQVSGRDVEDAAYTLSWDKNICSWTVTNQAALKPALSEAQQQIIDLLESEGRNFTTAEIAEATGIQKYEVSRQAAVLAAKGLIEKPIYGQWKAKTEFASLHLSRGLQTPQTSEPAGIRSEPAPAGPLEGEPDI